jgi:hypothetical protein
MGMDLIEERRWMGMDLIEERDKKDARMQSTFSWSQWQSQR